VTYFRMTYFAVANRQAVGSSGNRSIFNSSEAANYGGSLAHLGQRTKSLQEMVSRAATVADLISALAADITSKS
jgi:phage gp46-like protein